MTIVSTTTYTASTTELAGRMFNRSPLNLADPFFQDQQGRRRRLHQVTSYHNLDDIPSTVPTQQYGMKSCGGGAKFGSPQSVIDVKSFNPTDFEDDSAGVAIDLCLPVDDEYEDEDDLLLQQEEQVQHHQQQQQQQQLQSRAPCFQQHRTPRHSFLAPILEERKVAFASQHMVVRVDDADNSCAIDQRFVHQVFDAVKVTFIPHHTEYDEDIRANMWYTRAEMASMKEAARTRKNKTQKTQEEQQKFDTCSFFFPSPFDHKLSLGGSAAEQSSVERRARYEAMVDTVLLEQYEQRLMCLRVYGRVDEGFTGILDSDRLASVCAIAGATNESQERAESKATRALFALQDDDDDDSSVTSSSEDNNAASSPSPVRGSGTKQPKQYSNSKQQLKRTPSFNSSAIAIETSHCLDKGIGSVFRVLLSPFLEIRQGDVFLGIGEEMSVAV